MKLTDEQIAAIRERHGKVEPGPWAWEFVSDDNTCAVGVIVDDNGQTVEGQNDNTDFHVVESIACEVRGGEIAAFIAASWLDIKTLLDYADALEAENKALRGTLAAIPASAKGWA